MPTYKQKKIRVFLPFFFMLFFCAIEHPCQATPLLLDRLEASINTSLILLSDVNRFRETLALRAQLDPLFAGTPIAAQGEKTLSADIVDFLINEKMIAQQFSVTDSDVEQEINSIQSNNKIDRTRLRSALQEQGFSFEDYFELIRASASKRNLIDRDIRARVSISDEDVKNYFYNHFTPKTGVPLAYHVKLISVSPKSYKTPAAAKEAAHKARQDLQKGEAFEEVAKRLSDDASASSGGDLGVLTDDQMSAAIRGELKKLRIGQTSGVLVGPGGSFFILKLADVKSSETERFEKMKEEIRNQLAAAEYQHQISLWLQRQRQKSFIHKTGEPSITGVAVTP